MDDAVPADHDYEALARWNRITAGLDDLVLVPETGGTTLLVCSRCLAWQRNLGISPSINDALIAAADHECDEPPARPT